MTHRRVPRWRAGLLAALALAALGFLYASSLLLAATVIPLTYVAYGALSTVSPGAALDVERSVSPATPAPGESVAVTLRLTNAGESVLPDVRVIDGVPGGLAVVEGSPRRAVTLRPGESATVTYSVLARRGDHAFADPVVRLRPLSGSETLTAVVPAIGDDDLSCLHPLTDAPVGDATLSRAGTRPTDSGGEGIEFHSTRAYRPGDPLSRIHWRRFARTGDLTTVSFREERAVRTVLLVDARAVGRVTPRAGYPTGTELCGYAGERLYEGLTDAGAVVSVAAPGVPDGALDVPIGEGGVPWVGGSDDDADALARRLFQGIQRTAEAGEAPGDTAGGRSPATGADDGFGGTDGSDRATTPLDADESGRDGVDASGPDGDDVDAAREGAASPDGGRTGAPSTGSEPVGTSAAEEGGGAPSPGPRGRRLLARFPPTAQVVFVTPMLDEWPLALARGIRERGYPLTVVSPDVAGDGSTGQRVLGIERDARLRATERTGARTVRWRPGESADAALADSIAHLLSHSP